MFRFARLAVVTLAAVSLAGFTTIAQAGEGCSKSASAGSSCSTSKTAVKMASAGDACATKSASSGCAWSKQAMASGSDCQKVCAGAISSMASLEPFKFLKDVKADHVNLSVETTEDGFAFVFAGVQDGDAAVAKQAAAQSLEFINKPAHCDKTRGAMAEKSGGCDYTQACLSALADAEVKMVETETGAKTMVYSKDQEKVKQLHAFLQSLAPAAETPAKS